MKKDRGDRGGDDPLPGTQGRAPPLLFGLSHLQPGSCGGDSNDGDKGQEVSRSDGLWCLRHLYGCCFMLLPVSFINFAQEKLASSSSSLSVPPPPSRGQKHAGGSVGRGKARDDDIHSIISFSFSLRSLMEDEEEEGEDHAMLLLGRNRQRL